MGGDGGGVRGGVQQKGPKGSWKTEGTREEHTVRQDGGKARVKQRCLKGRETSHMKVGRLELEAQIRKRRVVNIKPTINTTKNQPVWVIGTYIYIK